MRRFRKSNSASRRKWNGTGKTDLFEKHKPIMQPIQEHLSEAYPLAVNEGIPY